MRDLAAIRSELAQVRSERRRIAATLPPTYRVDELEPDQRKDWDRTLVLAGREQALLGDECVVRGAGVRGRPGLVIDWGEDVLAPPEALEGVAEAWERVLRRRHPGAAWRVMP